MTIPRWGRITPAQGDMLMLAGYTMTRRPVTPGAVPSDEARLTAMRAGRAGLRRLTGHDCGYDLGRWHELLLASVGDEWGYRHPYAWRAVRPAVEQGITDPDRLRLARMLEAEG